MGRRRCVPPQPTNRTLRFRAPRLLPFSIFTLVLLCPRYPLLCPPCLLRFRPQAARRTITTRSQRSGPI
ncbi:hypothetical protein FKM82_023870 [Ascaphus truei]